MNVLSAIVRIRREEGFVSAMGHRVALHLGGEPELRRRVLAQLAQLDSPPETIRFERVGIDLSPVEELLPQPHVEARPSPEAQPEADALDPDTEPGTQPKRGARPPPRRKGKA